MEPEKGNPAIRVSQEDVRRAFEEAGAVPGDTILLHASLSSMGTVEGGAATVLEGCLDATQPGGTVAMPTLWWDGTDPAQNEETFDIHNSPAYNGLLAETLRRDPRSIRSNHFSHSVSAMGARAAELTRNHGEYGLAPSPWSEKAFADASPWARLYEWNALYAFIGVNMRVCTMKHYVESRHVQYIMAALPEEQREAKRNELSKDRVKRVWPFFAAAEMGEVFEQWGLMIRVPLGSANLRAIRTRPLVDAAARLLKEEPQKWFMPEYLAWQQKLACHLRKH